MDTYRQLVIPALQTLMDAGAHDVHLDPFSGWLGAGFPVQDWYVGKRFMYQDVLHEVVTNDTKEDVPGSRFGFLTATRAGSNDMWLKVLRYEKEIRPDGWPLEALELHDHMCS